MKHPAQSIKPRNRPHLTPWLGSPLAKDLTNGATISAAAIGFRPDEEFPARIWCKKRKKPIPSSFGASKRQRKGRGAGWLPWLTHRPSCRRSSVDLRAAAAPPPSAPPQEASKHAQQQRSLTAGRALVGPLAIGARLEALRPYRLHCSNRRCQLWSCGALQLCDSKAFWAVAYPQPRRDCRRSSS